MGEPASAAMIVCPRCHSSFADTALNYCGKCGSDMRLRASDERAVASGGGGASDPTPYVSADMPTTDISLGDGSIDPMLGRVIDARYRVLERVGAGGMGVVYKVEHVAMGKIAALKMLHPTLTQEREVVKRFQREAEAVSLLTHPNTVQVFDFGQSQGCLYMVMEYLRGEDLSAIVRRDGPLDWKRAAPLLSQVCEALSEAHEKGIVHRDLKPENVLVTRGRDGREIVKVLDFGLAKLRTATDMGGVTSRGSVIGTPYYMSPEQIRAEEPDARSDVYSLGAMMYRLLSGEYPYAAKTPLAVLSQHLAEELVPMRVRKPELDLDARCDEIVRRCMEKDRDLRFASVDEVRTAIEAARGPDASPVPTRSDPSLKLTGAQKGIIAPVARREDFDRWERDIKLRRFIGVSLVPLLLAAAGGGIWYLQGHASAVHAVDVELEPNNNAAAANLIAIGPTVRGQIGKRLDVENSDRDFYRFRVEGTQPAVLRIELTGIPNMDLRLGIFDAAGKRLAEADSDGPGAGEVIPNLRVKPGEYYAEVREVWTVGRQATENITDWYTLSVAQHPLGVDEESEPDDTADTANKARLDRPIKGYLGKLNDVDVYRPEGPGGGTLSGLVTAIEGVDLRIVVVPFASALLEDPAKSVGAKVFDTGGAGMPERFAGIPWPPGQPPLVVVQRKDKPVDAKGHRAQLLGIDVPYSITLSTNH